MLRTLPDFLSTYWMYLAVLVVLFAVLSYFSEKFLAYLKKGLIIFAALFVLIAGYEMVTGKSILTLPSRVDKELSAPPKNVQTGHRYYKSYKERYGDALPEDK